MYVVKFLSRLHLNGTFNAFQCIESFNAFLLSMHSTFNAFHALRFKSFNAFTGKSLVSKERAIRTKAEDGSYQVYYISLVASTRKGVPRMLLYLFDYLSEKYDLNDTGVEAMNTTKLVEYYNKYHPTETTFYDQRKRQIMKTKMRMKTDFGQQENLWSTNPVGDPIDVYTLVHFFVEHEVSIHGEKAAFILDEVPILSSFEYRGKYRLSN